MKMAEEEPKFKYIPMKRDVDCCFCKVCEDCKQMVDFGWDGKGWQYVCEECASWLKSVN